MLKAKPFFGLASMIAPQSDASPSEGKCLTDSLLKNLLIYLKPRLLEITKMHQIPL